jgi:hypothetical protein
MPSAAGGNALAPSLHARSTLKDRRHRSNSTLLTDDLAAHPAHL